MTTIAELEVQLKLAEESPREFFGTDIEGSLKDIRVQCHPDKFPGNDDDRQRADELFRRFGLASEKAKEPPVTITTKLRTYTLGKLIATGDVSDVFEATSGSALFTIKVSRVVGGDKLMAHEFETCSKVIEEAGTGIYRKYLPTMVETMRGRDAIAKQVTVFHRYEGVKYLTLEQIAEKSKDGLDGRHLAWIYKRLLECLGCVHQQGLVHNAVLPPHVLIFPKTHGISLLDWKTAGPSAPLKMISAKYRDWYPLEATAKQATTPATDIYLATKCIIYLAGGDPVSEAIPPSVPRQMATYFRSALMVRASMRPQDAWEFHAEFSEMLLELYGKPRFVELEVS